MRLRTLALLNLLLVSSSVSLARANRFPPQAIRQAVLGCWDVGYGITLSMSEYGKHSLLATTRFPPNQRWKDTKAELSQLAVWSEQKGAFEVQCRPRSQHGSFCLLRPHQDGLMVHVYAIRYGNPNLGHLTESFVSQRCSK